MHFFEKNDKLKTTEKQICFLKSFVYIKNFKLVKRSKTIMGCIS